MSKLGKMGANLYSGAYSVDFVGRRKQWYVVSLLIMLVAVGGLVFRGLNFGIEFRGGVEFTAQVQSTPSSYVEDMSTAVVDTEIEAAANPVVVPSGQDAVRIQTEPMGPDEIQIVAQALSAAGATEVSQSSIGPTWGSSVANKALLGLFVFLVLVVLFIWAYFREWRMSVAALIALAHDLIITVGVYALTGFEVTPATVTGFLTILGYSLYDTVVVFDKVRENTRGVVTSTRRTYADSANLAVNQTLVRSVNTSIAALLPVGALLYVGVVYLGSGPLKDLALALFVGMASGAYSSIFIATPLLAQLKMREPSMVAQAKRVAARRTQAGREGGETGVRTGATAVGAGQPVPVASVSTGAPTGASTGAPTGAPVRRRPTPAPPRPAGASAAKRVQPRRQPRAKRGKDS